MLQMDGRRLSDGGSATGNLTEKMRERTDEQLNSFIFAKREIGYSIISIIYIIIYIILIYSMRIKAELKTETVQLFVCPHLIKNSALLYGRTELYECFEISLLYLLHDGLESLGIVHGEVGEHLAVDLDTSLVESTHQL